MTNSGGRVFSAPWRGAAAGFVAALALGALLPHTAATLDVISLVACAVALALVVAQAVVRARRRHLVRVGWAAVGAFSLVASLNFFGGYFGARAHTTDFIHYYLGARYHTQVRYDGLYLCTAAVLQDVDRSHRDFGLRDLAHDDAIRPMSEQRSEIQACRDRFDEATWKQFSADVMTFLRFIPPSTFQLVLSDHGYNPSPAATAWAQLLIRLAGNTAEGALSLQWVDVAYVLLFGALVLWAFGPEAFGVAGVFFLAHVPSASVWTLGSLSRFDWLLLLIAGFVALKKRSPALAGAAWAVSTVLRVFPLVVFFGAALTLFADRGTRAGRSRELGRLFLGAAVAAALTFGLSTAALGPESWSGWKENLDRHARSTSANLIGLSALASYREGSRLGDFDLSTNAFEPLWREARVEAQAERQGWVVAGWGAALLIYLAGRRRGTLRENAAVSLGLVPVFFSLSGYYMAALLGLGFGARSRRWLGAALVIAALATQVVRQGSANSWPMDTQFVAHGIIDAALVFAAMAISSFRGRRGFALKKQAAPTKQQP